MSRPREVYPSVFTFRVPRDECTSLLQLITACRARTRGAPAPNSMNKYGLTLSGAEARERMAELQRWYVEPIVHGHYEGVRLKANPYAFIVDYEMDKQRALAAHDDSSDVTLNLCLGTKWESGELVFYDKAGKKPVFTLEHRVGQAIVHRGKHIHRAKPITAGARTNLILWCAARKK